ncbi:MAG: hypothetical protein RJA63_2283 [Pseudomonadota bacterium]|jgi:hypothetical protein
MDLALCSRRKAGSRLAAVAWEAGRAGRGDREEKDLALRDRPFGRRSPLECVGYAKPDDDGRPLFLQVLALTRQIPL